MIIEDERNSDAPVQEWTKASSLEVELVEDENRHFQEFLTRHRQIKDKETHITLRNALIDHLWDEHMNSEN